MLNTNPVFFKLSEKEPQEEKLYLWKFEIEGLCVTALQKVSNRSAGFGYKNSPTFSCWNGYSLTLPTKLEWTETEETNYNLSKYITVMDKTLEPCVFCKNIPKIIPDNMSKLLWNKTTLYYSLECCDVINYKKNKLNTLIDEWNKAVNI